MGKVKQIVTHLVLTIVMCLIPSIALAQNTSEHFKFMGIPINGTYENFVQKLKLKGFKKFRNTEMYKGLYDNDTSLVMPIIDENLNIVYCVDVFKMKDVTNIDEENILYPKFETLVIRLENKYNKEAEKLDGKYEKFIPVFKNNKNIGHVTIQIKKVNDLSLLSITYYDVANLIRHQSQRDKDL